MLLTGSFYALELYFGVTESEMWNLEYCFFDLKILYIEFETDSFVVIVPVALAACAAARVMSFMFDQIQI